ncbi:LysM receptor kinase, putative [Medicago truncatula]|uniref:LysM receptor kinase, putative n=1 Tax=Medicago truncatula TaxID=3880 RepID=G7K1S7_MEDTR|nr:LysM receptor kinase, putative [Medicago truncatula]
MAMAGNGAYGSHACIHCTYLIHQASLDEAVCFRDLPPYLSSSPHPSASPPSAVPKHHYYRFPPGKDDFNKPHHSHRVLTAVIIAVATFFFLLILFIIVWKVVKKCSAVPDQGAAGLELGHLPAQEERQDPGPSSPGSPDKRRRYVYDLIANTYYASLTTVEVLKKFNSYNPKHIPVKAKVNVIMMLISIKMEMMFPCILVFVIYIYAKYFQKKEEEKTKLTRISMAVSTQDGNASGSGEYETSGSCGHATGSDAGLTGILVAKSTGFSYQELAKATDILFDCKIAVKKMDVQASIDFLCELKVLTHVLLEYGIPFNILSHTCYI